MRPPTGDVPRFTGEVEFTERFAPRPGVSHVLFDFDGTLSLIREGWPDVMLPMFVEMLPPRPGEADADVRRLLLDYILRLNGQQPISHMWQFDVRYCERG